MLSAVRVVSAKPAILIYPHCFCQGVQQQAGGAEFRASESQPSSPGSREDWFWIAALSLYYIILYLLYRERGCYLQSSKRTLKISWALLAVQRFTFPTVGMLRKLFLVPLLIGLTTDDNFFFYAQPCTEVSQLVSQRIYNWKPRFRELLGCFSQWNGHKVRMALCKYADVSATNGLGFMLVGWVQGFVQSSVFKTNQQSAWAFWRYL